ncbi:copper resistance protein CopC [Cytobacillus spongiae]|jgi:methionine-rich copper-binding protein CopC|uniref:copper resistance CopC family protein n=1 Tax=Cytobacillus spongiae TaxID=2901381 RepID=UPI001F24C0F1|nr:copper resistance CopC family protein [Cytobacillus spongiae]UII56141.1 copper resistance protein CopC [Cytobacillus spongiae]
MFKKILVLCLFLFGLANTAFAHTGLESSNPNDGDVLTEPVKEMTFTFETKIEQGSTFELVDPSGVKVPIGDIALNDNQMKGSVQRALDNGEYTVQWSIIGADGHLIDGTFSFVVDIEEAEESTEEQEIDPTDESAATEEEKEMEESTSSSSSFSEEASDTEQSSMPFSILIIMLVIIGLILTGMFFIIFKKKSE